ncbi:PH domain-containing protein [Neobacillus massiliamazoniensis]|uniref:Membrane-flanked domain-containing protein n=1 Tax=Neobacillus massiliamazoniensis TaxID=1499688 RepID=A0A0U1P4B9_9BACI|nr:membrane-flanked domain-containing protein [Neobacillus massiliamazoniensis]
MTKSQRYHPLLLLFHLGKTIKNSFFAIVFLFVIKMGSKSAFTFYSRWTLLLILVIISISQIFKWFTHKYELDDRSFHLYEGIFRKSERTIPFAKIQNISRHTNLFHRIFKLTSISFETGMKGDDATVKFEVISQKEADRIEAHITRPKRDESTSSSISHDDQILSSEMEIKNVDSERRIHFRPTIRDIFKASFTSLSFLVLIPFCFKIIDKLHVEKEAEGIITSIVKSWWIAAMIISIFIVASVIFGMVRTFIKYGKYEISSDFERIYITKGVIDETAFSISTR